jgi:tetrahydromethanopterin S-methyltransferase subunit A
MPLMGEFGAQQFKQPVSICTLTDDDLRDQLMKLPELSDVLVGSLHTENLGIEHIIAYCLENPHIRTILLCGEDGKKAIGHLPGQSLLALVQNGLDEKGTIIGAEGKRPVIQNISAEAVAHFRKTVTILDYIGETDPQKILALTQVCIEQSPGPAERFCGETMATAQPVVTLQGWIPDRMHCDPTGYFVIYACHDRMLLVMEHYKKNGILSTILEGKTGPELYHAAVECGLVSRLDHAAYLGRELERAQEALRTGQPYVQDAGSPYTPSVE